MPYASNRRRRRSWRSWSWSSELLLVRKDDFLMPPEPLPWDRFRDRKHGHGYGYDNGHHNHNNSNSNNNNNNLGGGGGPGPGGRWRDTSSSSSPFGSRSNTEFSPRWGFPSSEFRRPLGHGKQGGWHMYHEDSHGYSTPRSGDRFLDDDWPRPSGPRGDGRYGRPYRENRNGFGQKDWRSHSWENNHHHSGPANTPGRSHNVNEQRTVSDSPIRASHTHSDPCDQLQSKDQADKTNNTNESGMNQKLDKENSLGSLEWKTLKWSRSGSLTSRGSGFSHSSSSKSIGGDSSDLKGDLPQKNGTPIQSPSEEAVAFPSSAPPEDMASRKKPRLGWGEGLAKYEKKKVEGPEENVNKFENTSSLSNVEPSRSVSSSLVDKSPKITGFSDCSPPATPSSFACSSSPGLEDKAYGKATDGDGDVNNFSVSSMPMCESEPAGSQFSLEKLELNSIANLSSLLNDLLQADDQCSTDSGFMRSSALNKLLLWKADISKALELTETEIDSLENELKSMKADSGQAVLFPASLNSLPADDKNGAHDGLNGFTRPPPLEVVSSGDMAVENKLPYEDARVVQAESKDVDIESPGTATSKFVEPTSIQNVASPDGCRHACFGYTGFDSTNSMPENLATRFNEEMTAGISCQGDNEKVILDDNVATLIEHPGLYDKKEGNAWKPLIASNRDNCTKSSEVFIKLLPSRDCRLDSAEASRASCLPADSTIKEKIWRRKRSIRFKERVLSLKYRAFQHLWKEDLRLLSLRSHRTKPQKKLDMGPRTMHIGNQKHRASIRSRFASPAGSLSLVPTSEIINFTGKLLSDSQAKVYRSSLKMPAMILDEKEKISARFVSSNGLVEDPWAIEKEKMLINPWTTEEKRIFLEKLDIYGKDFRKISSFLDHKTTADCVEFYYKNHKSECFKKTKKVDENKQYLLTSGKKWSREMNAASLDILGAASVIASEADQAIKSSKLLSGKLSSRKSRGPDGLFEASSSFCVAEDERETAAADVLAGICGSLSSEAMSSCITSSVDPGEGNQEWKRQKVGFSGRRPLTPDVTQNVDDDTCSDESCGEMDPVDWTDDEKSLFVRAYTSHGKDFLMISRCVRTKSRDQCKVFFSKARKCLGLDTLHPAGSGGVLGSNDTNGGGSDTEDACVVETGSVVYSDKSGSRMDEGLPHMNQDVSKPEDAVTDLNTSEENCMGQSDDKDADMESEVLCAGDHVADVSGLVCGGVVGLKDDKSAAADDLERSGAYTMTQDDTLKADATIGIAAVEVSPYASNVSVNCKSLSVVTDGNSFAKCGNGEIHVSNAPIDYEVPRGGLTGDELHQTHSSCSMISRGSSQNLKDFPLDLSMKVDMNDFTHKAGSEGRGQSFQDCYLRKCSRVAPQKSVAELPLLHRSEGQTNDYAGSSSSSKTDKPCGNGDVKLFGKILSKPLADRGTSGVQGHDERAKQHCTSVSKFDRKATANQDTNGNSGSAKHDHNSFLGLENVPIRTYGIWDGTKIQPGYPSATDSALLLAKYPAAFANYSISSPKTEQAGVNVSECNINGACLSPREFNCSNGSVIDYSVFRNQEGVQPFRIEVKQRHDVFPEVQRNGFDTMASLQPNGKGLIKMNVVQGGDILGGSCNGISDPVAALNIHYASQQFSGGSQAVNGIIREEWRGQGDVGR